MNCKVNVSNPTDGDPVLGRILVATNHNQQDFSQPEVQNSLVIYCDFVGVSIHNHGGRVFL